MNEKEFKPAKMMCGACHEVLQSKFEGQFMVCKCGKSYVDQTRHYERYGGEVTTYKEDAEDAVFD